MRLRTQEFDLPPASLAGLIETRLMGLSSALPPRHPDEDQADVFVDIAEMDAFWRDNLQAAVAQLLLKWVGEFKPDDAARVEALGELCYRTYAQELIR